MSWKRWAVGILLASLISVLADELVGHSSSEANLARQGQAQASANIARKRAEAADQIAALWKQGRYQEAYRVAAEYQALQEEIDREVDRIERLIDAGLIDPGPP